jgi:hypothetical protein
VSYKEEIMKKLIPATVLTALMTLTPLATGHAWAAKNCPDGSHPAKGPDPTKVYCYDNADPSQVVKIISA